MSDRLSGGKAEPSAMLPSVPCAEGMSLREALLWAARLIAASGSTTPRLDAEVLLGHVLGLSRAQLHAHWDDPLTSAQARRYAELVPRRAAHEPVAYLLGQKPFYDLELYVDRRALIPRPETEHLLEEALAWGQAHQPHEGRPLRVVDVGTGSGALAIVLARHLPQAQVWAGDISPEALALAARNLGRYDLRERVMLVCTDLLSAFGGQFDLIVANLPYISRGELPSLPRDVAEYEPQVALDGGEEGLEMIRRLLAQAPERLASPGLLLLEIDHRQGDKVLEMAQAHLPDAEVTLLRDYAGLERVVRAERP
jgi:release factor glutamine methyltransferase